MTQKTPTNKEKQKKNQQQQHQARTKISVIKCLRRNKNE